MSPEFIGKSLPLSAKGLTAVCERLGTRSPEIWTVLSVEASDCGFLPDRRPKLRFERHIFRRLTHGKYDIHRDISNPSHGGREASGASGYELLAKAVMLDEDAALYSASWGIGQVMGFNAKAAGFTGVRSMINAMVESEDNQVAAMAGFMASKQLGATLKSHDWDEFAKVYNGDTTGTYAAKLSEAFDKHTASQPDLDVRAAQVLLTYLGFHPGEVDGVMGPKTKRALEEFQQKEGLPTTGAADPASVQRLRTKLA